MNYEKVILSTDCDAGLNVLWKWFKEKKYEVTWSSLFVNDWKDGKENVNNMTEFSFSNARNAPDKFKEGIKSKIDELLKQL